MLLVRINNWSFPGFIPSIDIISRQLCHSCPIANNKTIKCILYNSQRVSTVTVSHYLALIKYLHRGTAMRFENNNNHISSPLISGAGWMILQFPEAAEVLVVNFLNCLPEYASWLSAARIIQEESCWQIFCNGLQLLHRYSLCILLIARKLIRLCLCQCLAISLIRPPVARPRTLVGNFFRLI